MRYSYYGEAMTELAIKNPNDFNYPALVTWIWKHIYWVKPETQSWAEYHDMTDTFINGLCDLIGCILNGRLEALGGLEEFITFTHDEYIQNKDRVEELEKQIAELKAKLSKFRRSPKGKSL